MSYKLLSTKPSSCTSPWYAFILFVHTRDKHVIQTHDELQVMTNLLRHATAQGTAGRSKRVVCLLRYHRPSETSHSAVLRSRCSHHPQSCSSRFSAQESTTKGNECEFLERSLLFVRDPAARRPTLDSFPLSGSFIITIITLCSPAEFTGTGTLLWTGGFFSVSIPFHKHSIVFLSTALSLHGTHPSL